MHVLPEFDRKITQRNIGGGHRYKVEGFDCTTCANCRKGKPCIGLPSVTGITGKYSDGNMYGAGYSAAFNTVFGSYTNSDKTALDGQGILTTVPLADAATIDLRHLAEAVQTPSQKGIAIGNLVHGMLQEWLQARIDGVEPLIAIAPEIRDQAAEIVHWLDRHECEILDVEVSVYHPELLYAGQVDCVARRGSSLLVMDWKSGKGIYKDYAAQVAAYIMAYEAMTGQTVSEGWVLRSGVDGSFEAKKIADLNAAKMLFVNLHSVKEAWEQIQWEDVK
jgi:hypothetical protein